MPLSPGQLTLEHGLGSAKSPVLGQWVATVPSASVAVALCEVPGWPSPGSESLLKHAHKGETRSSTLASKATKVQGKESMCVGCDMEGCQTCCPVLGPPQKAAPSIGATKKTLISKEANSTPSLHFIFYCFHVLRHSGSYRPQSPKPKTQNPKP